MGDVINAGGHGATHASRFCPFEGTGCFPYRKTRNRRYGAGTTIGALLLSAPPPVQISYHNEARKPMIEILIAIGAVILAALGWGFHQRKAGIASEREKQSAREAKARTIADEVDNDIGAMPPDEARKELSRWSKP